MPVQSDLLFHRPFDLANQTNVTGKWVWANNPQMSPLPCHHGHVTVYPNGRESSLPWFVLSMRARHAGVRTMTGGVTA